MMPWWKKKKGTCPACQYPEGHILDLPDNTNPYWWGDETMDKWCVKHRTRRGYLENLKKAVEEEYRE